MSNTLLTIIVVAIGLVVQLAVAFLAGRSKAAAIRTLILPISLIVWTVVGAYVLEIWVIGPGLAEWLRKFRLLAVITGVAWALVRFLGMQRGEENHWWKRLVVLAVVVASLLVGFQVLGINTAGVLAFGGFSAVAVGIAGRELFANLFGGRMLFLTQSFREGERINAPKVGVKGVVQKIGWYQTTLLTHSESPMTVPNSFFMSQVVINESRAKWCERHVEVDVRAAELKKAVAALTPIVESIELQGIEGDVAHLRLTTRVPFYQEQTSRLFLSEQLIEALGDALLSLTFE